MQIQVKLELFEEANSLEPLFETDWLAATLKQSSKTTLRLPIENDKLIRRARIHVKYPSKIETKTLVQNFGLHCVNNVSSTVLVSGNPFCFFSWWNVPYSPSLDILLAQEDRRRTVYTECDEENGQIHALVERFDERCLLSFCKDDSEMQSVRKAMQETESTFCVEITLESFAPLAFDQPCT